MSETTTVSSRSEAFPTQRFGQSVPLTSVGRPQRIDGQHMTLVELLSGRR